MAILRRDVALKYTPEAGSNVSLTPGTSFIPVQSGVPQILNATILLQEDFDDPNFSSRGWYDLAGNFQLDPVNTYSGPNAARFDFAIGDVVPPNGRGRFLFPETESVFLQYRVRYSSSYIGSGVPFHPHEWRLLTNEDGAFVGPASTHLTQLIETTYVPGAGVLGRVLATDQLNIDNSQIGVDLTQITENRAAHGCNGFLEFTHSSFDCFDGGGGIHQNARVWPDPTGLSISIENQVNWNKIAYFTQMNTISGGIGQQDGVLQYWVNDVLLIDLHNVVWRTGQFPNMKFNQLLLSPFIGNGSPVAQTIWYDELILASVPTAPGIPPGNPLAITLLPNTTFQTMQGWEATAQIGQNEFNGTINPGGADFADIQVEVLDRTVNELGVNRVRLEVRPGTENTTDYFALWQAGTISTTAFLAGMYNPVNDNGDPNVRDDLGFIWGELDSDIVNVVDPMRALMLANGESLHVNLCFVDFGGLSHFMVLDPAEYAENILAVFDHINDTYGWVPDSVEMILEPDNGTPYNGTRIGNNIVAVEARLAAAGFTGTEYVAPSVTNAGNAISFINAINAVSGAQALITEYSYHRYAGATSANIQAIGDRGIADGKRTSMLEFTADYVMLMEDLLLGNNSAWAQFTINWYDSDGTDNGGKYYMTDDSDVNNLVLRAGVRTRFLRQFFQYVRKDAVRIGTNTVLTNLTPFAWINADGKYTVVAESLRGADVIDIGDLPPATYGRSYSTSSEENTQLQDVTITAGQAVSVAMPANGVLTVWAKDPPSVPPPANPFPTPDLLDNANFETDFDGFTNNAGGTPSGVGGATVVRSTVRAFEGATSVNATIAPGGSACQFTFDYGVRSEVYVRFYYYVTQIPNDNHKWVRFQTPGFSGVHGGLYTNAGSDNVLWAFDDSTPGNIANRFTVLGTADQQTNGWHWWEINYDAAVGRVRFWHDGVIVVPVANGNNTIVGDYLHSGGGGQASPDRLVFNDTVNAGNSVSAPYFYDKIAISTTRIGPDAFAIPDLINNDSFETDFDGWQDNSGGDPTGVGGATIIRSTARSFSGSWASDATMPPGGTALQFNKQFGTQTHTFTRHYWYATQWPTDEHKFIRWQVAGFGPLPYHLQTSNPQSPWYFGFTNDVLGGAPNWFDSLGAASNFLNAWHSWEVELDTTGNGRARFWIDGVPVLPTPNGTTGNFISGGYLHSDGASGPAVDIGMVTLHGTINAGNVNTCRFHEDRIAVSTQRIGP